MGTYVDDNNATSALKRQSEEPELRFRSSVSHTRITRSTLITEEALVQKFENVGLTSNENETAYDDHDGLNGSRLYPLRPYAEDCPYYLRTGTCKFGLNCKFNHPVKGTNQFVSDKEGLSEKSEASGQIECKYYLTAGGCKYGKSCRYNHSKEESEIPPPELNFLGLPIRLGEKECPFYMRNGSCGYGARCRFHHPDPTSVAGSEPYNSSCSDEFVGQFGRSSGNCNGESVPLHLSGASHPTQASWSPHMMSDATSVHYLDNRSSYMPATLSLPQAVHQNSEWNGYQTPNYPPERSRHPHLAPAANNFIKNADFSTQVEEFPERPGQPECDYYMKTGDCKFKSACRYHHPKNWASKTDVCVLSDKGLPLRPGRKICWFYEQYGICKYGRACLFDHPVNHDSSPFALRSILEPPGSGTGPVGRMAGCRDVSEAMIQHSV